MARRRRFTALVTRIARPLQRSTVRTPECRTRTIVPCGVLVCALITAACAPGAADTSRSAHSTLTIAFPQNVTGTDVGTAQLANMLTVEGLTHVTSDGRVTPRLAESWTWENNGLSLRLHLRPGVRFHNGTPLTSRVVATLLRSMVARPSLRAFFPSLADITDIRPDGDLQLVLRLAEPSAFLPEELDVPLAVDEANIGTGPYRIVKRTESELVLEAFDQYYLGAPAIKRITVRPFDTLRTAWASLLRGDVDMVTEVPPDAIEFVRNDAVEVYSFERRYQYVVAFNEKRQPFTSPQVRRALNLAIDRDELLKQVLHGHGETATGPIWPRHWAYDTAVQPYGYDAREAGALLDAAGFPANGLPARADAPPARLRFTCLIPMGFSIMERVALDVQKQLYGQGIDMHLEPVPVAEYDKRIRQGEFEGVLLDMISGPALIRPYIFWRSAKRYHGFNVFGYENPDAERLFQVLRSTRTEAAVRSATHRLQQVMLADPPALFLAWSDRTRAVRRSFGVVQEAEGDPLLTLWRWSTDKDFRASLAQ